MLTAITLSLPVGSDLEFEKVGELVYSVDEGSAKPIYALNVEMGTPRLSLARPLSGEIVALAAALAARLNTEQGSRRAYSLLRTSLDRASDDLQGFIAAWSALEIFVNGVFKSTHEVRWFAIMAEGAPESANPIFERFADVMKDKYRLADRDQAIQRRISRLLGSPHDIGERRRRGQMAIDNLHVRTQMAVAEKRYAQSGGHRGNDACSARAFEDGFEVRSPVLPDVERPASVKASSKERNGTGPSGSHDSSRDLTQCKASRNSTTSVGRTSWANTCIMAMSSSPRSSIDRNLGSCGPLF